jgi:hypothetical protein
MGASSVPPALNREDEPVTMIWPRVQKQNRLGREIAWALAFKSVALVILYAAFFSAPQRVAADPERTAVAILGPAAAGDGY